MKFTWGTGIAIVYTLFVIVMIGMVIYSKTFDHSLVVDNYYEEDLAYQSHIDKVKNARTLEQDLIIQEDKEQQIVLFKFPREFRQISGSIWFYRASDKSKDFKINIEVDSDGQVIVPFKNLATGLWKVKVDWGGDGKPFYKEVTIVL